MSTTTVVVPIVTAVEGLKQVTGPLRPWQTSNKTQCTFLREYFEPCRAEFADLEEIETKASCNAGELNAFAAKKGFPNLKLDEFGPGEVGVVSVLDLLVAWLVPGIKVPVKHGGKKYPGFRLSEGVQFCMAPKHDNPIAVLNTKSNDRVCVTVLTENVPQGFALEAFAKTLSATKQYAGGFDAVICPMVDLNQMVDIGWLKGMTTFSLDGKDWTISQAMQQTKLRMNEKGARAQSAVAIGAVTTSISMPQPDLIIDQPFLIWFERDGLSRPLFVGHITPEDWKEPADLETA